MQKRLLLLLLVSVNCSLIAQPYVYNFNGDLTGSGPTLTEAFDPGPCSFTTPAAGGNFSSQAITTSCPSSPTQMAFNFNQGGGLSFDNSASLIGDTYTINMLFKFNAYPPNTYQRLINFSNSVNNDEGIYVYQNCALLDPNAPACPAPPFVAGNFYLATLVRDGSFGLGTNQVDFYVDGALVDSYVDAGGLYVPGTTTSPIMFFIDDACEEGDGSIRYLSLSPLASTAAEVTTTWNGICAAILPLNLLDFSADKQNNAVALNWAAENELNTSHFEVERSADGRNFTKLSDISAINGATRRNYSFIDRQPLSGTGFYRLKLLDMDGHFKYSGILKINFSGSPQFEVYPNPVKDVITIGGIRGNGNIRLINAEGRQVLQKTTSGQSMTVDVSKYPSGVYVVLYSDGEKTQSQKILKE